MGRGLLLIVGSIVLGGSILLTGGVQHGVQGAGGRLSEHQASVLAREIALTGMSEAENIIFSDGVLSTNLITGDVAGDLFGTATLDGDHMSGTYRVSYEVVNHPGADEEENDTLLDDVDDLVDDLGGLLGLGGVAGVVDEVTDEVEDLLTCKDETPPSTYLEVRSTGRQPMGSGDDVARHTVETTYEATYGSRPEYLEFAIFAQGNLTLDDEARILSSDVNANVHVNGDVLRTGDHHEVTGFGTYAGAALPSWDLDEVFDPVENAAGRPAHQQVEAEAMPALDLDVLRLQADRLITGNMVLDVAQELTLGTLLDPALVYVEGDLVIADSVSVLGYGALIVEGDVRISDHVNLDLSIGCLALGLNLLIYSRGSVEVSGGGIVEGQFFVANDFVIEEDAELRGSVVALGDVVLRERATLRFGLATPALIDPFGIRVTPTKMRQWAH